MTRYRLRYNLPPNDPRVLDITELEMRVDERRWYYREGLLDPDGALKSTFTEDEIPDDGHDYVRIEGGDGIRDLFMRAPEIFADEAGQAALAAMSEEHLMAMMDRAGRERSNM